MEPPSSTPIASSGGSRTGNGPAGNGGRNDTLADWLAEPEERGAEFIGGKIVYKAMPTIQHGRSQGRLYARLSDPYDRRPGAGGPGGWWLSQEVDIVIRGDGVRPDACGWRRDRVPRIPQPEEIAPGRKAIVVVPDWVCEVLSPSTAGRDLGKKLGIYHAGQVGHYWIVDPDHRTLTVYRHINEGYLVVAVAGEEETLKAEPFGEVEISVADLLAE